MRRHDWRDTMRVATDLALLGLLVTTAALPVVTAGAAVAAGSAAMHHYLEYDSWPGPRFCWSVFRGRLVSGLAATAVCTVALALVVADLLALRAGAVPGGVPMMVLTVAAAAVAAGYAGLVAVAVGAADSARQQPSGPAYLGESVASGGACLGEPVAPGAAYPEEALTERDAGTFAWLSPVPGGRRPATVAAAAGVIVLAVVVGMLVHPALSPVLAGYTLFALHVVARRRQNQRPANPRIAERV